MGLLVMDLSAVRNKLTMLVICIMLVTWTMNVERGHTIVVRMQIVNFHWCRLMVEIINVRVNKGTVEMGTVAVQNMVKVVNGSSVVKRFIMDATQMQRVS